MEIIYKNPKELIPYEKNTKKHDKKQIDNVAESIKQFGFVQPVVIDKDNVIVIGHCRTLASRKLKMKEVPCVLVDTLTEEQIKALRIVDNKSNESSWDLDFLSEELETIDLSAFEFDFKIDGFDDKQEIVEDTPPEVDEVNHPKSQIGDIYILGNHRLICGDSTDANVVDKLMDGQKAKILFTSPPYSNMREYNGNKDLSVDNISNFIPAYRKYTDYQCINLGIQRKNHEIIQYWDEYILKAKQAGYKLLSWNVWDKGECGSIGQQSAFIPIRHEWIFVFGTDFYEINKTWEKKADSIKDGKGTHPVRQKDGSMKRSSIGDRSSPYKQMESVLALRPELGKIRELHPATFPVGLPAEYIKAMTDEKDNVIEPFGGSGTTLIACEQLNRKCYVCELDPYYCDVIIQRWENLTGQKAKLIRKESESND